MKDLKELLNIPNDLKLEALWCCWKYVPNQDGDIIKKPFNPLTGYGAKSNDKSTFTTYPIMLRYLHRYWKINEDGKMLGGLGLGIFNGFSAIDIDDCVKDGKLSDMAQDIVDYCQSYTEYSPSRTGIRIIFKTDCRIDKTKHYINNSKLGLEIYISDNTNKFVTITGNSLNVSNEIKKVDIQYILDKYMKKEVQLFAQPSEPVYRNVSMSLNEALQRDDKLYNLWYSKAPGSHSNESELDMSLCCKLAFYLNDDFDKIKEAFESSPYYKSKDELHKNKWNRDYGIMTINSAINFVRRTYQPIQRPQYNPTPTTVNKTYDLTDTGNAERFIDKYENNLKYNVDSKQWYIWNGKYWQIDVKNKVRSFIDELALEMKKEMFEEDDLAKRKVFQSNLAHIQNSSGKDNLLKEASYMGNIPILTSELDSDGYLLCAPNMVYNLRTNEKLPFDKSYLISQTLACDIDLENEPKLFINFLNDIFQGDKDLIHYVHKVFGYCLTDSTVEQSFWMFYGDGNDGKSLLLDIIREAMGSYAITSRAELLVDTGKNGNTEELARLKGKRLVIVEETERDDKLREGRIKNLTSGIGNIVARFLYANSIEFTMTGKIMIATNYLPNIKGVDKGIWRRTKVIPCTRSLSDEEVDKHLKEKLMKELPQIIGWLIKGYQMYIEEGLKEPNKVNEFIKQYKQENNIIELWLQECCEFGEGYYIKATPLYTHYSSYCKAGNEPPMTQTLFGKLLGKKFKKKNFGTGMTYIGIRLKDGQEDLTKKVQYESVVIDKEKI